MRADQQPGPRAASLADGWWARGLTLGERCGLSGSPRPVPGMAERADRRLARWREAHELAESGQFTRRLAAVGLSESQLKALLVESPASLASRATRPAWAELVEAVVARLPQRQPVPDPAGPEPVAWQAGFSVVGGPFVELAYERLSAAVSAEGLDAVADLAELRGGFSGGLGVSLVGLASRTLVLELNVLRVTGRLTGETPQQRFWSFVRHFAQRQGLVELLAEYPVLARLLAQATGQAVDSWLELLHRFAADRQRIVADVFGGADPGRLVEVSTGQGDTHHGGRSVALLRFDGGARLVYKPRPLAVHVHFNQCLDWLNRRLPELGLRTLAVVDRGRYGWVEFADHRPCEDRAGLERYYRRQGALLALLYALDGADFHFENLIASGDQPVLVDLEALFHPVLPTGSELLDGDPARVMYEASVSRVGLLPALVFGENGASLDMGGNGGDAGQATPFRTAGWSGEGTDEMRLVREQATFPGSQNRARLGEVSVDATEFAAELRDGFRAAYDVVAGHRADLAGPGGLLERFAGDELRLVARTTHGYATLLYESTHPDVLRDALDRDRILDYLWAISVDDPARERLIEYERRDLWAGDIPLFAIRPDTTDVWASTGDRLAGLLAEVGLDRVRCKLARLGPSDREAQEWIVRASLATRQVATGRSGGLDGQEVVVPDRLALAGAVDPERVLAAARAVGDALAGTAYRDRDRVGWLGMHFLDESQWLVQPLGYDLYGGYPGVSLFLSQLAELTGEQRYAELAHGVLAPVVPLVDQVAGARYGAAGCGAFSSVVGLAYALVHVAANLAEPELLSPVEPILTAVAGSVPQDKGYDVITGSAGALAVASAIYQTTGLAVARELARACADRLVESAQAQEHGVAWHTTVNATAPLTGFSHGTAGIGWALLKYAATTGENKYAEVGLDAWRYERSQYSPEIGNWPDVRIIVGAPPVDPDQPAPSMDAWCHGAPGIGLARADSRHVDTPEVAADLDLAVRSTLAAGPSPNHSLCHGLLGNLELLNLTEHPERAAWAARAVASFEDVGPVCGTPAGISTPGLMTGLAGIGHGLLRLGFPDRVPAALLLQPPRVGR